MTINPLIFLLVKNKKTEIIMFLYFDLVKCRYCREDEYFIQCVQQHKIVVHYNLFCNVKHWRNQFADHTREQLPRRSEKKGVRKPTLSRTRARLTCTRRYNVYWDAITFPTKTEEIPYNPWNKWILWWFPDTTKNTQVWNNCFRSLVSEDHRTTNAKCVTMLSASHRLFSCVFRTIPVRLKDRCLWNELWYINIKKK